jgi:hypothetical protein
LSEGQREQHLFRLDGDRERRAALFVDDVDLGRSSSSWLQQHTVAINSHTKEGRRATIPITSSILPSAHAMKKSISDTCC